MVPAKNPKTPSTAPQAPIPTRTLPRPRTSDQRTTRAGSSISQPTASVTVAAVRAPGCAAAVASWVAGDPSEPAGQKNDEAMWTTGEAMSSRPATVRRFMESSG